MSSEKNGEVAGIELHNNRSICVVNQTENENIFQNF